MPTVFDPAQIDLTTIIRPGDVVAWGQALAEPLPLTAALMNQRHRIGKFGVFVGIAHAQPLKAEYADYIKFVGYIGTGHRELLDAGKLDIMPCHYSEVGRMVASGALKIDVLMVQVSPPNKNGDYSFGMANDFLVPAITRARVVIAEVNAQCPWTHGERTLCASDFHYIVNTSRPLPEMKLGEQSIIEQQIAKNAAAFIEDGATLQFGVGVLPEAILAQLKDRRDLGVHSGTIGDQTAALIEAGVITNARKSIDRGATVATFLMGTSRIAAFAHQNPAIQLRACTYTHNADVLAKIDRFAAINSAFEVDLTGQVSSEVARDSYVGAVGGAGDFLRAAARSADGVPLVALPSRAKTVSRIVSQLSGPVSTPRSDAGIIVTEFGAADLRGSTLSQRIKRMIAIAHPEDRENLERSAIALPGAARD